MTRIDAELKSLLQDLESEVEKTRRDAIVGCVQLGERSLPAIPLLQRLAAQDPAATHRHMARKALHQLSLEASRVPGTPPIPAPVAGPAVAATVAPATCWPGGVIVLLAAGVAWVCGGGTMSPGPPRPVPGPAAKPRRL